MRQKMIAGGPPSRPPTYPDSNSSSSSNMNGGPPPKAPPPAPSSSFSSASSSSDSSEWAQKRLEYENEIRSLKEKLKRQGKGTSARSSLVLETGQTIDQYFGAGAGSQSPPPAEYVRTINLKI